MKKVEIRRTVNKQNMKIGNATVEIILSKTNTFTKFLIDNAISNAKKDGRKTIKIRDLEAPKQMTMEQSEKDEMDEDGQAEHNAIQERIKKGVPFER